MVHALREVWRVLRRRGLMIDLRPRMSNAPVEVVANGRAQLAGRLEGEPDDPDDAAADESLRQAGRYGWFKLEREARFDFAFYWDTPDEMNDYISERWTERVPELLVARLHRMLARVDGARVRVWRPMVISRWRKV